MEVWRAYHNNYIIIIIIIKQRVFLKNTLKKVEAVSVPCEISFDEVKAVVKKFKKKKAAGTFGVVSDMLKAARDVSSEWVMDFCNAVVKEGRIPEDWNKNWMINVYKGKGAALECSSHRGIELLCHVVQFWKGHQVWERSP